MKRILLSVMCVVGMTWLAWAGDVNKELNSAADLMKDMTSSNQIPTSLLEQSKCIAVIPDVTKAGFGIGGKHGDGVVSCRTGQGWSAPAFLNLTGGSVGFQAGVAKQDVILLMNEQGAQQLREGHWDMGAEAVAAGPTGGAEASSATGWKAPVLSYTRSSGAYAGASLAGSKLSADDDMIRNQYGGSASFQKVLDGQVQPNPSAKPFMSALDQVAQK